jgi:REP element-mobilizing transposase RayT
LGIIAVVKFDSFRHHRRSIRLPGYDYAAGGSYFITICTAGRECVFGEVTDGEMILSDAGRIAEEEWLRSTQIRRELTAGAFVVMPNHLHGIVTVEPNDPSAHVGAHGVRPVSIPPGRSRGSIGSFVAGFKSAATRRINEAHDTVGTSVWQRNYYEHVVRGEDDYYRIVEYIRDNPRRWAEDEYNPVRVAL